MSEVTFQLDEAASLGHHLMVEDALDKFRAYGVRLQLFYQSIGQLKKCWPNGQDVTLFSNTSQVFFGVQEPETAEFVSKRLGEETIVVGSGGTSIGNTRQWQENGSPGSGSRSSNDNSNWQQQARRLLKPEEVIALTPRVAITFTPGRPPIQTRLVRYYEGLPHTGAASRRLDARAKMKVFGLAVAALFLTGYMAWSLTKVAMTAMTSPAAAYPAVDHQPAVEPAPSGSARPVRKR